jgi:hypothetical protein
MIQVSNVAKPSIKCNTPDPEKKPICRILEVILHHPKLEKKGAYGIPNDKLDKPKLGVVDS